MANSKFVLVVETTQDALTTASEIGTAVGGNPYTTGAGAWQLIDKIAAFIQSQAIGRGLLIRYADTAVSASTTGTFTGAPTAGDTITLNGVAFTARATASLANEFTIGSSVTATASNLVTAIQASTTAGVVNTVGATSAAGVVTFFSIVPGPVGKALVLSESCNNFTLADTTLSTGGTQAHNATIAAGINVATAT